MGVMTKDMHSASYVFTDFSNTSGWSSDGVSWLVGLLSTVDPFLGYISNTQMQCAHADKLSDTMPPPIFPRNSRILKIRTHRNARLNRGQRHHGSGLLHHHPVLPWRPVRAPHIGHRLSIRPALLQHHREPCRSDVPNIDPRLHRTGSELFRPHIHKPDGMGIRQRQSSSLFPILCPPGQEEWTSSQNVHSSYISPVPAGAGIHRQHHSIQRRDLHGCPGHVFVIRTSHRIHAGIRTQSRVAASNRVLQSRSLGLDGQYYRLAMGIRCHVIQHVSQRATGQRAKYELCFSCAWRLDDTGGYLLLLFSTADVSGTDRVSLRRSSI